MKYIEKYLNEIDLVIEKIPKASTYRQLDDALLDILILYEKIYRWINGIQNRRPNEPVLNRQVLEIRQYYREAKQAIRQAKTMMMESGEYDRFDYLNFRDINL